MFGKGVIFEQRKEFNIELKEDILSSWLAITRSIQNCYLNSC